jgi:alpha-beta hydrolase superfamily lysophospholipase
MAMKLAQRIAIGYYRTKFKTLALVSPRKAAEAAFKLFCTPYSGKPKRETPAIFHKAKKISFQLDDIITVRGFQWKPEHTNGKKILIVHGFDSCSYKYEKYVTALLSDGFEVLAFDAPGHGISDGKTINVLIYRNTLLKINEQFGPLYGIMAHSLGGLSTSLAVEQMNHIKKLILIAPVTETTTAMVTFAKFVGLNNALIKEMEQVIVDYGKKPISYYSASRAIQNINVPTLWLHDEDDKICPITDVIPIQKLALPHVQFYITKALGHNKIYRNPTTMKQIISFFNNN